MAFTYASMAGSFGKLTGAACNPARVFGPAIMGRQYLKTVFIASSQILAAVLASFLGEFMIYSEEKNKEHKEELKLTHKMTQDANDFAMASEDQLAFEDVDEDGVYKDQSFDFNQNYNQDPEEEEEEGLQDDQPFLGEAEGEITKGNNALESDDEDAEYFGDEAL